MEINVLDVSIWACGFSTVLMTSVRIDCKKKIKNVFIVLWNLTKNQQKLQYFKKHLCYTEKHSQFLTDLEKSAVVIVVQWAKYYS